MKNLIPLAVLALVFAFAPMLEAQRGDRGQGRNQGQGQGQGPGQGQGQRDREREALDRIGWGEDGKEERILPGQAVDDKVKDARLEEIATKLELTDKKIRASFKKIGKKAWTDSEAEDKRWATIFKSLGTDDKKKEEETKKHMDRLAKVWTSADEDMTKKEVLNETQLETWKSETKDLRAETATDKSARQDEIRARRIKELRDHITGAGAPAAGSTEREKKEKKEDE